MIRCISVVNISFLIVFISMITIKQLLTQNKHINIKKTKTKIKNKLKPNWAYFGKKKTKKTKQNNKRHLTKLTKPKVV